MKAKDLPVSKLTWSICKENNQPWTKPNQTLSIFILKPINSSHKMQMLPPKHEFMKIKIIRIISPSLFYLISTRFSPRSSRSSSQTPTHHKLYHFWFHQIYLSCLVLWRTHSIRKLLCRNPLIVTIEIWCGIMHPTWLHQLVNLEIQQTILHKVMLKVLVKLDHCLRWKISLNSAKYSNIKA